MSGPEAVVEATTYTVSCLPSGSIDQQAWSISVQQCNTPDNGGRTWAVRHSSQCLSRSGDWAYESSPSGRTKAFLRSHRFTLDEAIAAAKKHAPLIVINGLTAADVLARRRA